MTLGDLVAADALPQGATSAPPAPSTPAPPTAVLDVVVPVYNEEDDLESCVRRLHEYLTAGVPYTFRITVADNASTDGTLAIAHRLAEEFPELHVVYMAQKGKGRALRAVWSTSESPVLAYMDVDLSTDLAAVLPLIAPLVSAHSDLAIGTRLHRGSRVVRGAKRAFISRSYNLMLRHTLSARFSDAQCGFKAIRREVAARLLPLVEDDGWFFDTELLILAERSGMRIHEVPVDWIDDPNSSVNIVRTAGADLRGIARLVRAFAGGRIPLHDVRDQLGRAPLEPVTPGVPPGLTRQLIRFAAVGVVSTVFYLLLFMLLRTFLDAQPANAVTLLVAAVANTALNRRFTFGIHGRATIARHQLQGLIVFALVLALTSGSLAVAHSIDATLPGGVELLVLLGANIAATLMRFLLLRNWVFRSS